MPIAYTDRYNICSRHILMMRLCYEHRKDQDRMDEKNDLQDIYGQVIRRERQDRGLTIKELAEKAGLSEIYLGEIERGQKYPSANVLESIARALDLDLAEFFE